MADVTASRAGGALNWNSVLIVAGFFISTGITLATVSGTFTEVRLKAEDASKTADDAAADVGAAEDRLIVVEQRAAQTAGELSAVELRVTAALEDVKRNVLRESEETQALLRALLEAAPADDRRR